jgi:ubiquinone/menaquinone biosynthesis C-methylase UbiE
VDISTWRFIRSHFDLQPDDILVDAGGGTGIWAKRMASKVKHAIVLEKFEAVGGYTTTLEQLQNLGFKGKSIQLIIGDLYHLPFKSGVIHKIFCHHVLEHLDNPHRAFEEFSRALAPGGILLLAGPHSKYYSFAISDRLSRIIPARIKQRLPSLLLGDLIRFGYSEWKRQIGHLRDGYTVSEIEGLCLDNGMRLERFSYQHKLLGALSVELSDSVPLLFYLLIPLMDIWYVLEQKIRGKGLNLVAKCVKEK